MPNAAQIRTYNSIRDEIARLRVFAPQPKQVTELTDCPNPRDAGYLGHISIGELAKFHVGDARVFIEESGKIVDDGLPDCPRYANCLVRDSLPAIAADLLMEGNPHKPFLDINSHTRESFESYLQTGIPLQRELPFPIAIVSRKMGNEVNGMRSFYLLLDLFEVVIRFIVLVQIADLRRRCQQIPAEWLGWLSRPSPGHWVKMFDSLRESPPEEPFLAETEALRRINRRVLDDFVKLRNDTKGHGKTLAEARYRSLFEENIGKMERLLRDVSFLKNYWLVKPISMENDGAHLRASAWKLTGDNPTFDKRNIPLDSRLKNDLPTNAVVYLKGTPRDLEPLVLDPYVILEICKECRREELLLFDKCSSNKITYLGYETCPEPDKPSYPYVDRLPPELRKACGA